MNMIEEVGNHFGAPQRAIGLINESNNVVAKINALMNVWKNVHGEKKNEFTKLSSTYHSAGKHDRGPLFFTLFSFRLIRSLSAGSI